MKVAIVSWKYKVGVKSCEKQGNLMTIVLIYHHSEGGSGMCLPILQQLGICERKEPPEDGRARKLACLVPYTHLECLHNRRMDRSSNCFAATILQCECTLWQVTNKEGPLVAHSGHKWQAHPSEWSARMLGGAEVEWTEVKCSFIYF